MAMRIMTAPSLAARPLAATFLASQNVPRAVLFHSGRALNQNSADAAPALRPTDKVPQFPPSPSSGSVHWNLERGLSVVTAGLLVAPLAVGAGNPIVDFSLGVVVPVHIHAGLENIVLDYVPYRKYGHLYTVALWATRAFTGLALYGAYQFNTNDVGVTEFVKRLWHASDKKE
ncbi:membrane anchor subunit of succinate dehydrogenase, Sdh4 [Gonapodya sp. JEL0774]|nr:membrane anchor subunit of succinate dehydrogenase, Sdh4 [Gonapodya sp. JEL0774]